MTNRSSRPDVRNPVLRLDVAQRFRDLPPEARKALRAFLTELADEAGDLADKSWRTRKYQTAAYWKAIAAYARHVRAATPPVGPARQLDLVAWLDEQA